MTTSPTSRAKEAWLQRTVSQAGRNLGQVRDRVFELGAVQRHHLVLDMNAGSGLLTWEAVRRAPEGGVWALTADAQAGEALRQQAERLPDLERPAVLIGEPDELEYLLTLRGEDDIRFDRILARNPFTFYVLRFSLEELVGLLVGWLAGDGRIVIAQSIPRHGQRLYEVVDWSGVDAELAEKVKVAEEAIYSDETDPLVNWDESDLEAALRAAGLEQVHVQVERQTEPRRITAGHLERWFGEGEVVEEGRLRYGGRLQEAALTAAEVEQVAILYRRQLLEQVVAWQTAVVYLVAGR